MLRTGCELAPEARVSIIALLWGRLAAGAEGADGDCAIAFALPLLPFGGAAGSGTVAMQKRNGCRAVASAVRIQPSPE